MGLTAAQKRARNASYQARWRERRDAREKARPEVVEGELVQRAEACLNYPRGTDNSVSGAERVELADRLQDLAMGHFHAMHRLNRLATKVREG